LLEETDKLAKAKLAAVEIFQTQIADDVKIVRQNKLQLAKKVKSHIFDYRHLRFYFTNESSEPGPIESGAR
jgi:hypothetical protein